MHFEETCSVEVKTIIDTSINQIDMGKTWIPILNNIHAKTGEDQLLYHVGKKVISSTAENQPGESIS